MRRAQRFSLESLESRCLLSNITGNITPYPIPLNPGGVQLNPGDITAAGGKLWFTESGNANAIGMLDPSNPDAAKAFSQGLSSAPGVITTGPDGNAWFAEPSAGKIGMIITSGSITEFALPSGADPQGITAYTMPGTKTGTIWYTDSKNNAIGSISINPNNNYVVNSEIKDTAGTIPGGSQIVTGTDSDSTLWFSAYNSSTGQYAIGSYDPATNGFGPQALLASAQVPYGIATGPDGNIWFSEAVSNTGGVSGFASSALGVINPSTPSATPKEYGNIPTTSSSAELPFRIVEGPDGNIWYTGNIDSAIGMFNVATQKFASQDIPQWQGENSSPAPDGITVGPDPDNLNVESIWFADSFGAVDVKLLASQLVVTSPPPVTTTAGTEFSVGVTATDSSGYTDPTYNGNVTLAVANSLGGNPVTLMATPSQGVATFPVTLESAGTYSLTATANGLTATPSVSFNVVAPTASKLVLAQSPPATVTAGNGFDVKVKAEDTFGNVDLTYSGSVTLAEANNVGGNPVTLTAIASQGVATFPGVTLDTAGSYSLTATAKGLTATPSSGVSVVAAAASQLVITQQPPATVTAGSGFPVAVALKDEFGNATNFSGNVNLALSSNPSNILQTVPVNGGSSALFSGLTWNNLGNYSLLFTASGLTSATSSSFTVVSVPVSVPPPAASVVTNQKTNPKTHKPIGKPVLIGYQFIFDTAMSLSITDVNDYQVQTYVQVTVKNGKKKTKVLKLQPIPFSLKPISNNGVQVILAGKQAFKYGGQITLVATPPAGISSTAGGFLNGNAVYNIAKGGFGISYA